MACCLDTIPKKTAIEAQPSTRVFVLVARPYGLAGVLHDEKRRRIKERVPEMKKKENRRQYTDWVKEEEVVKWKKNWVERVEQVRGIVFIKVGRRERARERDVSYRE